MINNSLLYIQKNILSTLINFTNTYFNENQFNDIKIELRQLNVLDTSYEGMVVVFKKFAHSLDIPIENLVKFNEGLEKF